MTDIVNLLPAMTKYILVELQEGSLGQGQDWGPQVQLPLSGGQPPPLLLTAEVPEVPLTQQVLPCQDTRNQLTLFLLQEYQPLRG